MESKRSLVTVTLAIMVAACTSSSGSAGLGAEEHATPAQQGLSRDAGAPPCPSDGGTCVPVSPPSVLEGACPLNRWIAVLADDEVSCPEVPRDGKGQWVRSQLFAGSTGGWPLPPGLSPFCAYDWISDGSEPPSELDVRMLRTAIDPSVERADPDCQVVAPLGTSATVKVAWQTLHADFHEQTGRLASLPLNTNLPPAQVRVAVVDSAPHVYDNGEAVEDRLGHGYAMGRVIRELGCPEWSAACIAQVANHLALPQVTPNVKDVVHGGFFGQQALLATSIHAAVSEWRSHNAGQVPLEGATAPQPRMVINLSLAWDGRYGGPYTGNQVEQLPAPVQAVHASITHARCRGNLVIAAAGNDPGGPDTVYGAMFPAGWEAKPAPGPAECDLFEGAGYPPGTEQYPLFPPAGSDVYQPLVYAVGGVRADDRPLESTRPGGRPRLAAPGAHAVASDIDPITGEERPTDVLTGTSGATAVVSGIVSTLWGYRPELPGAAVMALVRQGAVDLGVPADFCLGGAPCPWSPEDPRRSIRRVSLCQALVAACAGGLGNCPSQLEECTPRPAYDSPLPMLEQAQLDSIVFTRLVNGSSLDVELPPLTICGHASLRSNRWSYDKTVCPFRQYYGIPLQPWTNPQPSKNPCTLCVIQAVNTATPSPTATVYISIDSEYSSRSLYAPTLVLNEEHEIDLSGPLTLAGESELTGGDEIKMMGIPLDPAWLPIKSASLTLQGMEEGVAYSTSSELLVQ